MLIAYIANVSGIGRLAPPEGGFRLRWKKVSFHDGIQTVRYSLCNGNTKNFHFNDKGLVTVVSM